MSLYTDLEASFLGASRALIVQAAINPLKVLENRQCSSSLTTHHLAVTIFMQGGGKAFFSDLPYQMLKASIKGIWQWPMIMQLPKVFKGYQFTEIQSQALVGIAIASADAGFLTPLERGIARSASVGKRVPLQKLFHEGWKGIGMQWVRNSVLWVAFLTSQEFFRARAYDKTKTPLTLIQATVVGLKASIFVSAVGAPFIFANILQYTQNRPPLSPLTKQECVNLFRTSRITLTALALQNVGSAIIYNALKNDQNDDR